MDIKTSSKGAYLNRAIVAALVIVVIVAIYIRFGMRQSIVPNTSDKINNEGVCLTGTLSDRANIANREVVKVGGLSLVTATTEAEQIQGLSGVKCLAENEGMLFIFAKADKQGIWMKDMLIPLDIIWLDSDKRVIHIEHSVYPLTYPTVFAPKLAAKYVIEINSGAAIKLNIKESDIFGI